MNLFEKKEIKLLLRAFLSLETEAECQAFLEDLLTTKELLDISQRLMVAQLLDRQLVYSEIAKETGASSATISRGNRCYAFGAGGYTTVLPRLKAAEDTKEDTQ